MSDFYDESEIVTREAWLMQAIEQMRPWFAEAGHELPEQIRISTGWTKRASKDSIGWTWKSTAAEDKVSNVFISPELDDSVKVLEVVIHELVHVADDCNNGHKGPFKEIATALGLTGKMTATVAGEDLRDRLEALTVIIGDYPHAKMNVGGGVKTGAPKQTTRMIKLITDPEWCPCGYTVRTTKKWIEEGLPMCPHNMPMMIAD